MPENSEPKTILRDADVFRDIQHCSFSRALLSSTPFKNVRRVKGTRVVSTCALRVAPGPPAAPAVYLPVPF